ncbi:MAG: DUF763 domain-containing protein, partial [Methermicoccaceae archaeon]
EVICLEDGREELLRRLSDPYWFQALSHVLGFDWHSSGTTTTTCGALKVALSKHDLGVVVAGGKGATSRKTPSEITSYGDEMGIPPRRTEEMIRASRLAAKVDNACIQDGFTLYHHCFILSEDGVWAVVQQGMGDGYARRYHWLSLELDEFVSEPHTGICSDIVRQDALNMTARESKESRQCSLELVLDNPEHLRRYLVSQPQRSLFEFESAEHFAMPAHHEVLVSDIGERGMEVLRRAYELQPQSYEELIAIRGMGPKKIRALALLSDLVWGTKASWRDPVKYTFSHGGKDGYPYPVDRQTYDNTIEQLESAILEAKCESKERLNALKRLHEL